MVKGLIGLVGPAVRLTLGSAFGSATINGTAAVVGMGTGLSTSICATVPTNLRAAGAE